MRIIFLYEKNRISKFVKVAEALSFFPEPSEFHVGPEGYLDHIRKAKSAVDIPIIASLNGHTIGGWIDYAQKIEQAGADAIELNIYHIPTDLEQRSEDVEQIYVDILKAVKSEVKIPIALKLSPLAMCHTWRNASNRLEPTLSSYLIGFISQT